MPAHDDEMAPLLRAAFSALVEAAPAAPAFEQITHRARGLGTATGIPDQPRDFDLRGDGDGPAPRRPPRRASAALAVAAALLLVVGIMATSRNRGDLRSTGSAVPEVGGGTETNARPPAGSDEWSLTIHDASPFGDGDDSLVSAVVAGGPGFVAVGASGGHAAVWTSVDGREWSRLPHDESVFGGAGSTSMTDVTLGGPGLVAVGGEEHCTDRRVPGEPDPVTECTDTRAVVWTSADGVEWTRVAHDDSTFGERDFFRMSAVTRGGPGLVAVGRSEDFGGEESFVEGSPVDIDAAVWTSVDGVNWRRVDDPAVFGGDRHQEMLDVTAGGPGLVAVGREGSGFWWDNSRQEAAVWTSVDGLSWSRVPHDDEVFGSEGQPVMRSVAAGGPGLVAVGWSQPVPSSSPVWTSIDGRTWSLVAQEPAPVGAAVAVTAGGPGVVAVGSQGQRGAAWVSEDGLAWSEVPLGPSSAPGEGWVPGVLAADGGRLVGVGFTIENTSKEE